MEQFDEYAGRCSSEAGRGSESRSNLKKCAAATWAQTHQEACASVLCKHNASSQKFICARRAFNGSHRPFKRGSGRPAQCKARHCVWTTWGPHKCLWKKRKHQDTSVSVWSPTRPSPHTHSHPYPRRIDDRSEPCNPCSLIFQKTVEPTAKPR